MPTTNEPFFDNNRLGKSAIRTEDLSLLTGTGRYADDLPVSKGARSIAFLRSPHSHARIVSIDISRALSLDGVDAVITGDELAACTKPFMAAIKVPVFQYALAVENVRYFGECVCMIVATDRYVAEDAAELISVDYEMLPAVVDPVAAATPGSTVLHEEMGTNTVHDRSFNYGDVETEMAAADRRLRIRIKYPRNSGTPIECFHVSASYNSFEDSYEVTANFQGPFTLHPVMARALGVPGNRLRLKTPPDSGGSYGVKQAIFSYVVACCVAARLSGHPVRWSEDRLEHLAAASSATNRIVDIDAAVNADGRITALRFDQLEDCGAFLRAPEPATLYRMHGNLNGAYDIRNIAVRNRVVLTNKTPTGLVRGFGGPQLYFAIERLLEKIAVELGLDPIEVRKRNLIREDQMPYRTASGALLDSGNYLLSMERALKEGGYEALKTKRDIARKAGKLYGIGCAVVIEPSVSNMGYISALMTPEEREKSGPKNGSIATVTVAFDPSGSITVNTASVPQGQGHRTVLAQVIAEVFDVCEDEVVVSTDHDTVKDSWSIGSGNYSSRFAAAVAGTAFLAASALRDRIAKIAGAHFAVSDSEIRFSKGNVEAVGDASLSLPLSRLAASAHWSPLSMPDGADIGMRETANWVLPTLSEPDEDDRINSSGAYGFIFDFCGVAIDSDTGAVEVERYVTMHDAGRLLNPKLADGQILGGFAHGLGAALMEEFRYGNDGSFLTGTLADYLIPTACEVPSIQILHDETPSPFTPLGSKGLGEGNCMSTPVCLANAVSDALSFEDVSLPLTRSRVSEWVHAGEKPDTGAGSRSARVPPGDGSGVSGHGSLVVSATVEEVWNLLLDKHALANIIPGCKELEETSENQYRADMLIGVGPIKGRFVTKVGLKDLVPPTSLRLVGGASGPLGESEGEGQVTLTEIEDGTRLSYDYAVLISGKAASIGGRMLDGATRSFINLFFKQLTGQLNRRDKVSLWHRIRNFVLRTFQSKQ